MLYSFCRMLCSWVLHLIAWTEVANREVCNKYSSFILAANHVSNLDPIVLGVSCPKPVSFIAKEELFSTKFGNWLMTGLGVIPLKRGSSDIRAMRQALNQLRIKPLAIFPQGTRGGDFSSAKKGVGFLCKKGNVPVIPVKIEGTDKILPRGKKLFRFGKIRIVFGQPVNIEGVKDTEEIVDKVVDAIRQL